MNIIMKSIVIVKNKELVYNMENNKIKINESVKLYNDLILVRHAEAVEDNSISNNLLTLSTLGILQAQEVSKLLKNKFDIVFSSTSKRAIMTANIILQGKEPIQDARLLERGWGNSKQDGKETNEEAKIRFTNFLKEIIENYKNKRIVLVMHGALIKLAQDVIENNSTERERVNNCTTIKYNKNKEKKILR